MSSNGPPMGVFSYLFLENTCNKGVVSDVELNALLTPYFKGDSPAIKLTNDIYTEYLHQWKFSLIGRLDLSKIKLEEARDQLLSQWKIAGTVKLIPIGKGFFVIKINNEKDKIVIWSGANWKVAN